MENNQDIFDEAIGGWRTLSRDLSICRLVEIAQSRFDIELSYFYASRILTHHFDNNLTLREMRGPVGDMSDNALFDGIFRPPLFLSADFIHLVTHVASSFLSRFIWNWEKTLRFGKRMLDVS